MSSINDILGTLPSGKIASLTDDQLTKKLREDYLKNSAEFKRRSETRKKIDLYSDKGSLQMSELIDSLFEHPDNKSMLKKYIGLSSYQNLAKRIVNEISTVYSEAAKRTIQAGTQNEQYKALVSHVNLDAVLRKANRMLNLCGDVALFFNVRFGKVQLKVITPDNFYAVSHPCDETQMVAMILDQGENFLVVTDEESFMLDKNGRLITESRHPHGLSRMPIILVHNEVRTDSLLNYRTGADIAAAHKAIWLLNLLNVQTQKAGTTLVTISGDMKHADKGQPLLGSESAIILPGSVALKVHDLQQDPGNYIEAGRSIISQVAGNYGIPMSVIDLSYSASSGFEISLKRTALREIRNQQLLLWRSVEQDLAKVMSEVLTETTHAVIKSDFAFDASGFGINFSESELPRSPKELLSYMKELRSMGLLSTIEMLLKLNPEMSEQEAYEKLTQNARIEAHRVQYFRELNVSPDTPNEQIFNTPTDAENPDNKQPPADQNEETK